MTAATPGQADEAAPEIYRRWLSVDQPKNWAGPSDSLIEELWFEKSDEQKEFWRSLTVAAQDARPAPTSASQVRRHEAQAASDLADDFYFERKQVVALRAAPGEVFTCLAAGDPALLDDEQVAEWRERARMEES